MKFFELLRTTTLATAGVVVISTLPALASGDGKPGVSAGAGANAQVGLSNYNLLQSGGGGGKAPAIAPAIGPGFQGNPGASGGRLQGVGFCRLPDGGVAQYQYQTGVDLASKVRNTGVSVGVPQVSLGFNNSRVNPQDPVDPLRQLHAENRAASVVSCAALHVEDIHRMDLERSLKIHLGGLRGFVPQEESNSAPAPAPAPQGQGHKSPAIRGMW